jgi:mRNA-degrading endonuclease toxin of MazEF toxin-antitoxin module
LVVSGDDTNDDPTWPVVLGFPLSTSDEFASRFDVSLKKGAANLPQDCWVRVNMLQPIAKEKLREWIGSLDANNVELCLARLIEHIG